MYRAGIESMLGLRRRGGAFSVDPCIPSSWPEYEITWRLGATVYRIAVANPARVGRGVRHATVDGRTVDPAHIPLVIDGSEHAVRIELGARP